MTKTKSKKNKRVLPVMPYYGGKTRLAEWVNRYLPLSKAYLEVFTGSAAVGLARPASPIEVFNDADPGVSNLYEVIQKQPEELATQLRFTLHSRQEHAHCSLTNALAKGIEPIELARQHVVLIRQSYAGSFDGSWAYARKSGGGSFHGVTDLLPPVAQRLQKVTIENLHFRDLIAKYADLGPDATWYFDPPYVPETRVSEDVYRCEMTLEEHVEMLSLINTLPGMVVLSGYRSDLYDDALAGWKRMELDVACLAAATSTESCAKPRRTECLWINRAAQERLAQRN